MWDNYKTDSIKHDTRELRECGIGQQVTLAEKFLQIAFCMLMRKKKNYLMYLLQKETPRIVERKQIITFRQSVLTVLIHSSVNIYPCAHEEADTRIFIHSVDATRQQFRRFIF